MTAAPATPCMAHHWLLDAPCGPTIAAVCKRCGAERTYPAMPGETGFELRTDRSEATRASRVRGPAKPRRDPMRRRPPIPVPAPVREPAEPLVIRARVIVREPEHETPAGPFDTAIDPDLLVGMERLQAARRGGR